MKTETNDKARDADRTRQAILHAAQQIFTEKGFAEAGVRDITARAGVNQSLVSRYFGGKLKLFEAALDVALDARLMTDLPKLTDWFGGEVAEVKAAAFMVVSLGFFTYRDQLPLSQFAGPVEPALRRWLEDTFQSIVDR